MLNLRLDSLGMGWIIDEENGIVWHDGGHRQVQPVFGI